MQVIKAADGFTLAKKEELAQRWCEYGASLYNVDLNVDDKVLDAIVTPAMSDNANNNPILRTEVESAVNFLKNNKSAGFDNIPGELLRHGGDTLLAVLHRICAVCIGGMCVTNLRFADDIDLIASSVKELMDLTQRVDTSATRLGMQINASKTKSMAAPEGGGDLGCIQVGNERIEEVSQFKYLGAVITSDGKSDVDI